MTNTPNPITPIHSTSNRHTSAAPVGPLLVNVTQAAQILCVSRSSIYQLIWTDQLMPIRIGRSVRFSIEQLERFIAERTLHEHGPTLDASA
ncbi:MAG: helix-turn-helix domain-containing protein [Ilumatobacter sp.]